MIDDATTFRSKEQVFCDLAKALGFSAGSLQANRKGRVSKEQFKKSIQRCVKPAVLAVVFALAPILIWTRSLASSHSLPFGAAMPLLFHELTNVKDLFEAHGKMGGAMMLGSFLICLAITAILVSRFPFALYFDLLDGKVTTAEGRVVAREEQINRPNGRDPIEKYFFSLHHLNMQVNLAAYRAIENGSVYVLYLLPRSEELLSIEPKIEQ